MFLHLFIIFILLLILFYGYVKIKFKFWFRQPVFHFHNLLYWFVPPGLIDENIPQKNSFTNFYNIEFDSFQKDKFCPNINFIQNYYLQLQDVKFSPTSNHIVPYLENKVSYVSTFYDKHKNFKEMIGMMTSRKIELTIQNQKLDCFYVDYLCVHPDKRKQGIAPQLIQTHHYFQRRRNPNIYISLFKRENSINFLVPLVYYKSHGFDTTDWCFNVELPQNYKIIECTNYNQSYWLDFIKNNLNSYKCIIKEEDINIINLIESKNLLIYGILNNNKLEGLYFLRDAATLYKDKKGIDLIASIWKGKDKKWFVYGFNKILLKLKHYKFLFIEGLTDNDFILENIKLKYTPVCVSPTAYYLYNMGIRPIVSKDAFILL